MILSRVELKYNEFKCFGASALGYFQTGKCVSMKIVIKQAGDEAATLDQP